MRFAATIAYPADVETVAAMLANEEFVTRKMSAAGALRSSCDVARDGAAFTVTTRADMPTTKIPSAFRSFVGESLEVTMVEAWGGPAADGSRTSTLTLEINGVPVRVRGGQRLVPTPQGCEETYEGDVTASVPLMGRKIERTAVGTVDDVVAVERRLGLEHLAKTS
ncbi:hypothetical protein GCM10023169_11210 [Georgenia halophila]|uniref:DUF2505 domain-containing protein n=1 Tax=Georgenia halophila TaxID=620889 RepID=A0ABP8KU65_9MICO